MKKIKKTLIIIIIIFTNEVAVKAQQDPHFTQYVYNMSVLNPAYTGTNESTAIGLLGRTQWVGIEGAPNTVTLAISSPVGRNVGLGLSIVHDEIGPVKENNIYGDFSYTIDLSDYDKKLSFGIKAGVTLLNINLLGPLEENDPLNVPVDKTSPNFGVGAFYFTSKFYTGFSIPNLLKTRHLQKNGSSISTASEEQHYFFTSGYVFDLSESVKLKPSTMIRAAKGSPLSIDLSANLLFNDMFETGLSYRLGDAICGIIGFNVKPDFRIGYAYEHTVSNIGDFSSGSHEIMLIYNINRKNIKSPRFF